MGISRHVVVALLVIFLQLAVITPPSAVRAVSRNYELYSPQRKRELRDRVTALFRHGYDSYMEHAFPMDELKPLSCRGTDHFGGYALTLIDSLDMLALAGDHREFMRQAHYISANVTFAKDKRVSVFETTIRVVGGLLSGHVLAEALMKECAATKDFPSPLQGTAAHGKRDGVPFLDCADSSVFHYDGGLLQKAVEIADLLVPAFDTPTGIPYNEIHLLRGVDPSKGHTTCPAAAGSLLLEFGVLSALTENCTYVTLARRALEGLWKHRSPHNLVGTMIDVLSGRWTNAESHIGASIDSFFEYIYKAYILFDDVRYLEMWEVAYKAIQKYTFRSGWYLSSSTEFHGPLQHSDHKFNSLQAFWPGLQVLAGDVHGALMSYEKMYCIVRELRYMPEYVHLDSFLKRQAHAKRMGPGYPLRPEFLESTYYLYHATSEERLLEIAEGFLDSLEATKQPCGFAAVVDVFDLRFEDKMDSFVLAETFKYLYMIFSPTKSDIVRMKREGTLEYLHGTLRHAKMLYDLQEDFLVNTEAHPLHITTQQRATYHRCLSESAATRLPTNLEAKIADGFLAHDIDKYEHHHPATRTRLEREQRCPVVNYMLDVAPVVEDLLNKDRCFHSIDLRATGGATLGAQKQQQPQRQQQQRYSTHTNVQQQFQMPVYLPLDPLDPRSPMPMNLVLTYRAAMKRECTTFRLIATLDGIRQPEMLYMEPHAASVFADDANATFFTARANFGPNICLRATQQREEQQQQDRGVATNQAGDEFRDLGVLGVPLMRLVHLRGNGCPASVDDADGFFANPSATALNAESCGGGPGADTDACSRAPFAVLIPRGGCTFREKVEAAQRLGAAMAIIYNNEVSGGVTVMAEVESANKEDIAIPAFMISYEDAQRLQRTEESTQQGPQHMDHSVTLSRVSVVCARTAQEQFRAYGVGIDSSDADCLHMFRQRMAPLLPVARVRHAVAIMKDRHRPADPGARRSDGSLAAVLSANAPPTHHPLRRLLCPSARCQLTILTGLASDTDDQFVLPQPQRTVARFFEKQSQQQRPPAAQPTAGGAALGIVFDADTDALSPEAAQQIARIVAQRPTATPTTTPTATTTSDFASTVAFVAAATDRWSAIDVAVFAVEPFRGAAELFMQHEAQLVDSIVANAADWGIAAYFFGIDVTTGLCVEVLITTSESQLDALRNPEYHLARTILPFHVLTDSRDAVVDEKTRRHSRGGRNGN